jgi:DNA-binding NarL/FixJ family response regulator
VPSPEDLPVSLRCAIVDGDSRVLRAASNLLGRQGIDVVGVAATTEDAVRLVERTSPDVVLIDINLGSQSGFALTRLLAGLPVHSILMSTHDECDYANLIAESPADGFIAKADLSADAIRRLLGDID